MIISRYFTTIPDGTPVPNGVEVELRLHLDNSLVATTTTSGGWASFTMDGNPGPHYIRCLYNSEVQVVSSRATGVSSVTDIANLPLFIRSFVDGYVGDVLGELAVTASGSAMNVTVAGGAAYVRGVLYDQRASKNLTIAAPDSQPRIDRIVVEVVPPGGGTVTEGRSRLVVKTGTPASSPVAPSLTQTDALWEFPLAQVRVNPSVAAITNAVVTDERVALSPKIAPKSVTREMLADTARGIRVDRGGTIQKEFARKLDFAPTDFLLAANDASLDYSDPQNGFPWVSISLNRDDLLTWLEGELDIGGGTPATPLSFEWNDFNFNGKGTASGGGGTTLNTGSLTLPAGTWVIESELNYSVRGVSSGWSMVTSSLSGSGAPTGGDQSVRNFDCNNGIARMIVHSARRQVTPTSNTTYTVTGKAIAHTGSVEVLSGVLRMRAFRRS